MTCSDMIHPASTRQMFFCLLCLLLAPSGVSAGVLLAGPEHPAGEVVSLQQQVSRAIPELVSCFRDESRMHQAATLLLRPWQLLDMPAGTATVMVPPPIQRLLPDDLALDTDARSYGLQMQWDW